MPNCKDFIQVLNWQSDLGCCFLKSYVFPSLEVECWESKKWLLITDKWNWQVITISDSRIKSQGMSKQSYWRICSLSSFTACVWRKDAWFHSLQISPSLGLCEQTFEFNHVKNQGCWPSFCRFYSPRFRQHQSCSSRQSVVAIVVVGLHSTITCIARLPGTLCAEADHVWKGGKKYFTTSGENDGRVPY